MDRFIGISLRKWKWIDSTPLIEEGNAGVNEVVEIVPRVKLAVKVKRPQSSEVFLEKSPDYPPAACE